MTFLQIRRELPQAENFDESATLRAIANRFVISRSLVRTPLNSTNPQLQQRYHRQSSGRIPLTLAIEAIADLAHPALMLRYVGGFLLLFTHSWVSAGGAIVQVTATVLPVHCTPAQAQRIKACISPAADTIERAPLKTFDRETTSVTVYPDRTMTVRTITY